MTDSSNAEKQLTQLMHSFQAEKITVYLEKQVLKSDCYFLLDQSFRHKYSATIGFVLAENPFLPYLSLKENLFVGGTFKNRAQKKILTSYFDYLGLEPAILIKSIDALSFYEQVKLQLCRMLILNKNTIVIDDVFQKLSVFQRQELLPLIQKIAKAEKKAILILTSDPQIARSPYMDEIVNIA